MGDVLNEIRIPHAGLRKEIHEFTFRIDEKFFTDFEKSQIQKCNIDVHINMDKRQEPILLEVDLEGEVWSECDRCTAEIPLAVHTSFVIYVKYALTEEMKKAEDIDILYIGKDDLDIDITALVYDYLHLTLPIHRICDKPGKTEYCDKEIVKLLEKRQQENDTPADDPRWAELNKLKDKLN